MKNSVLRGLRLLAASAGVLFLAPDAEAEILRRAPYLQSTTHESAVIVWMTYEPGPSEVRYGSSPKSLNHVVTIDKSATHHEVKLTGLSPDTRYYYSVGSPGKTLAGATLEHYVQTNPAPGTAKKFRAWILGDSGDGGARQGAVRDSMLAYAGATRPDLFLHMGDIAYYSGTTEEFTSRFFAAYSKILQKTTCWPTLGNHEGVSSDSGLQTGPYFNAYVLPKGGEAGGLPSGTEAYYSFDYANVHFIVLDSQDSSRAVDGAMMTWMKADLMSTKQEWIVAYWHHPAYSKGTHNSDTEAQLIEMRQNALPILEAGGVDLVLAGHSHIYERSFLVDGAYDTPTTAAGHIVDSGDGKPLGKGPYVKPGGNAAHEGAVYVVAGHGGAGTGGLGGHPLMYFSEVTNGSCLLDVQGNRLSLVNVRWDGVVTDRFALVKGNALVLATPDGGESLEVGTTFDIRWATVGSVSKVNLEVSLDDGQTFTSIATAIPNTGTYAWSVPAVDSRRAIVRVSDASNAAMFDDSNGAFTLIGGAAEEVISFGSTWSYSDEGVDHGVEWLGPKFDASTWKSGKAQLGYGEGDEATTLIDVSPNYPSVYFRRTLTLDREVTKAALTVLHDDGAVVWINGKQVFSKYVGDPWYGAPAVAQSKDNEIDQVTLSLKENPFVIGDNVVAVMVKQVSDVSSDVSFDMALEIHKSVSEGTSSGSVGAGGESGANGAGGNGGAGMNTGGRPAMEDSGSCATRSAVSSGETMPWVALVLAGLLGRKKRTAQKEEKPCDD